MASDFVAMGLEVRTLEIDEAKLRDHPGYSPSIVSYQGRRNVLGLHRPQGPVRGRSLILNGPFPCTCYGAAGEHIHGIDEWVSLRSLHQVTAVMALFIARWCGVNRLPA